MQFMPESAMVDNMRPHGRHNIFKSLGLLTNYFWGKQFFLAISETIYLFPAW